jgi:hypothetical protein
MRGIVEGSPIQRTILATLGRVPIGTQRLRLEKPPGTKVVLCLHPDGHTPCWPPRPIPNKNPRSFSSIARINLSCFEKNATIATMRLGKKS